MDISRVRKRLKELRSGEGKKDTDQGEKARQEQKVTETGVEEARAMEAQTVEEALEVPPDTDVVEAEPVKEVELIAFRISNEDYAVRLLEIQEIINYRKATPVPRSPAYLRGVTFLRGKVLPVIDLKRRLELRGDGDEESKIIVLHTSKNEPVGAIVGPFIRVLRFPEREILQPPPTLSEREKRFIRGVVRMGERFISILNVDELVKMEVV
jgi:purine-binding chemotaxis protein CheW